MISLGELKPTIKEAYMHFKSRIKPVLKLILFYSRNKGQKLIKSEENKNPKVLCLSSHLTNLSTKIQTIAITFD